MIKGCAELRLLKPRAFSVSPESAQAWMRKIRLVQQSKVTPEMRARMQRRARAQQSAMIRSRKCKKMQSANRSVKKGFTKAMFRMRNAKMSLSAASALAAPAGAAGGGGGGYVSYRAATTTVAGGGHERVPGLGGERGSGNERRAAVAGRRR